jgi:hypothetical protein
MLKYKLKESALVNVNKNRCSLQINGDRPNGVRSGIIVVQPKIHLFSATNYNANHYYLQHCTGMHYIYR